MWWNIWHSLEQDPTRVANMDNMNFYRVYTICKEWETRGIWHRFCKKAVEAGEVCDRASVFIICAFLAKRA